MEQVKLHYPVTVNGADVEALNLRRPTVRDMLAADKARGSDAEKEIRMFCNLCEVGPEVIESLDLADYARLQKAYQGFLSSGRETPASSV